MPKTSASSRRSANPGFIEQSLYHRRIQITITQSDPYSSKESRTASLSFPVNQAEVKKAFRQIGIKPGQNDWEIIGMETEIPNLDTIDSRSDLNEFNVLAERIMHFTDREWDTFCAVLEAQYDTPTNLEEYIDLTYNLGCYGLYPKAVNTTELGKAVILQSNAIGDLTDFQTYVSPFLDYETLGESILKRKDGIFTQYGYVYETDQEWVPSFSRETYYDEAFSTQLLVDEENKRIK